MNELELYNSVRQEIINNHALMHWFSLVVILSLLAGVFIIENRNSILSVFLPLLSIAWAAAMVRFDFFIHRQNAYLRFLGNQLQQEGLRSPVWESWKESLQFTKFVIPTADIFAFLVVVIPTSYLLFGPSKHYFNHKGWSGHKIYVWLILSLLILLLGSLAVMPTIASFQ
jgi:hypothetical protein